MPVDGVISYDVRSTIIPTTHMTLQEQDYPSDDVIVSNFHTTVPPPQAARNQGKGNSSLSFPSYHVTEHLIVLSHWQQELIRLNHGITGKIVPIDISSSFKNLNIRYSLQESGGNMEYARHEKNCLLSYRYENRLGEDVIRLIRDPNLRNKLAA